MVISWEQWSRNDADAVVIAEFASTDHVSAGHSILSHTNRTRCTFGADARTVNWLHKHFARSIPLLWNFHHTFSYLWNQMCQLFFFFALFPASHYSNQINFPLRFHISHARPQAAALKWFAFLRDVSQHSTWICDDDVVSNVNDHDTNIFQFQRYKPHTHKNKDHHSKQPQNKSTFILDYQGSTNPKIK